MMRPAAHVWQTLSYQVEEWPHKLHGNLIVEIQEGRLQASAPFEAGCRLSAYQRIDLQRESSVFQLGKSGFMYT